MTTLSPFPGGSLSLVSTLSCHPNPIAHRVRRKRQRLPPSLLIENASDRVSVPCEVSCPGRFRSRLATTRPEPHLYASHNPVCAGIVDRVALLSKGGWDAFSKTPTASNPVICFRVELHLESEPTRRRCADSHTAKGLPSPCGGRCS